MWAYGTACTGVISEEMLAHAGRIAHERGTQVELIKAAANRILALMRTVSLQMIPKATRKQADVVALDNCPKDIAYVALSLSEEAVIWSLNRKLANGHARKAVRICIDTATVRNFIEHAR